MLRAIAEMDRETRPPTFTSAHEYIDPKSALSPRSAEPFGATIFTSSQFDHTGDERPLYTGSDLHAAVLPQPDFTFSSCDEDADGEPDESFQSEHSFWMSHPGDTSASTIASLGADDPPIPLLGRDGTWKGVPLQRSSARDDHQDTFHEQGDDSQQSLPLPFDGVEQIKEPALLYSAPTRRTRPQRSPAVSSSNEAESSRAAARKRKHEEDQDPLEQSKSSETRPQTRRTSKRRTQTSTPKRSTAPSRATRSNSERYGRAASSEAGSLSGDRNAPSPASSSGRYRLRKKDVVPQRSLAALLTPPRDKRAQTYDEAPNRSADWLDEVDPELDSGRRVPLPPPQAELAASEAPVRRADETVDRSAELDELEEIPARTATVREKGQRTFPAQWQMHPAFPLLYQRYCVPSSVSPEVLEMLLRGLTYAQ